MNILWDFDGTLFDTYPVYTSIISKVLGSTVDKQEIYNNLKISYLHTIDYYKISRKQKEKISFLKKSISPRDIYPFQGVEEVLKYADKNVIMTHKRKAGVLSISKFYGWEKHFVDMVTFDDGFPRKPNPSAYLYLHKKYHLDLAIGDRELDLIPAKELGIATCIFQGQSRVADYQIDNYSDFFKLDFSHIKVND